MLILAGAALFVLVYTYVGYPIVIALMARLRPFRATRDPSQTPMVSACIPVFNAKDYIAAKIESLLALDYPEQRLEILLLSDCSSDGSDEILADYAARYPGRLRYLRSETRLGKPAALNEMKRHAKGSVLLMTDIRQPLDSRCLRTLCSYFADESVGAVSGNLELSGAIGAGVYWKYEKWIRKNEGDFRSMVGVTGAIYAVRSELVSDLPKDITLDDVWVPMKVRLAGYRVVFAPKAVAYDEAFADDREFGRKARTLAGNYQLFARLPQLLLPFVNPSWFETVSHKVARLVCPWALLVLAISSCLLFARSNELGDLESVFVYALCAGQTTFYLLAILGAKGGKLGRVARTFVVMNFAALVGLGRFIRGGQKITW